ncbi:hypothetical protein LINPERHAP2_LOCUS17730 [Linum perenne]
MAMAGIPKPHPQLTFSWTQTSTELATNAPTLMEK